MWAGGNNHLLIFFMKVCLVTTAKKLLSKILLWPLTFSLLFKGEKNCIALQWSIFASEISSRFKSVKTQGVWGAEVVSSWPSHLCCSLGVGVLLWGCALLCLAKETASIRQRSHPSDFLSWVQLAIQGVGRAMPAFRRLARLMSALWSFQRMLIKLFSS